MGPYNWVFYFFYYYAIAYFDAGEILSKSCVNCSKNRENIDVLIYPIIFCYRQGVELSLKAICLILRYVCEDISDIDKTYDLLKLWESMKKYLDKLKSLPKTWKKFLKL
ncbi:hypothetical protein OMAG_001157 [Candidatus Omnitrophus magneticus]|uniref:Uncharacterized protein n=1 Tax=Candidatus Omnitrophus magneticus TaxID=1609969 RepID=A0A0F0CNT3_9BACT|nr:hypothetical protein OMAG_001157 [Candidatus Omnitrophus magneticus]